MITIARRVFQEGFVTLSKRGFSSISVYDIQEFTSQEKNPFTENPTNKFDVITDEIEFQRVGPTFGQDITEKGIRALVIFLSLIALLISIRYEYRYAAIALIALLHDLLLTFSIYVLIF